MENNKNTKAVNKILEKLQKENMFTDQSKAEVLKQAFSELSEEELQSITKSLL